VRKLRGRQRGAAQRDGEVGLQAAHGGVHGFAGLHVAAEVAGVVAHAVGGARGGARAVGGRAAEPRREVERAE
jgi:hypothetical protein